MKITKRKAKGVVADMIANIDEDSLARTREKMERITEDYCSFEVARLLKKKGFDERSRIKYCQISDNEIFAVENEQVTIDEVYIPTHQMAMKWLREKEVYLNIRIALNRMEDDVINNIHWVVDILDFSSGEWKDNNIWTDTYEEAVEAALKYALENLI